MTTMSWRAMSGRPSSALALLEVLARGDHARRAHDAAAGVGGRTAHPQVAHRGLVPGPAGHRPVEEQLLQGEFAGEDVALTQARDVLDVLRGHELVALDQVADVGEALLQRVDHVLAEGLALGVV